MSNIEQTLSIIKPDAVERNLDEKIKSIFVKEGFKIVKEKKIKHQFYIFASHWFISYCI